MEYINQIQNDIPLSISNEIACVRGREDMLHLIRNSLKLHIDFDDSFILRYNKATKTCRSYIFHVEKSQLQNPDFKSRLDIEYPVDDDSITNSNTTFVQDVDLLLSDDNQQVSFIHNTGIKEFVTLKLAEGNKLIGFFVLLSEKKHSFTPEALDLLKKISYPISIATANIIANEEIAKKEEEKNLLLSLSNEF